MAKYYNYKTAMLSIFIDCMGDGFSDVVLEYKNVSDKQKYFRQLRYQMNRGNKNAYNKLCCLLRDTLCGFVDGDFADENARYCHKHASDKYDNLYRGLGLPPEPYENFFYEKDEDVIAYLVVKWILPLCMKEKGLDGKDFAESQVDEDWQPDKEWVEWEKQAFRPEYDSALCDIFINLRKNKTFYKWAIDEFYQPLSSELADKIIQEVFGENDNTPTTTFEKLKYESGKHNWGTFDKLFQNELNNPVLMELLKEESVLEAYQIFQSRMLMAYFFENLRAILPDYVGKINASKIWDILIHTAEDKSTKTDLKVAFFSPDYDEKNEMYAESVKNLFFSDTDTEFKKNLENLDKDCPATELFYSFAILNRANRTYPRPVLTNYKKLVQNCKNNAKYYGQFINYSGFGLKDILW